MSRFNLKELKLGRFKCIEFWNFCCAWCSRNSTPGCSSLGEI